MGDAEDFLDEDKRMEALQSYHILDSLAEKDYEDITALASIICDVPIALISFVDHDRQWFKSNHGLDVTETLREHSFCSHAIKTPGSPFIIPDSRQDIRFKDNPLVTGKPNIVFYAGIPLVAKGGFGLGTVCIIDDKPRVLTDKQMEALQILSGQVIKLLELRRANNNLSGSNILLEAENKSLDDTLLERMAEIARQNTELEKVNKELQSFAYISSHDLQEPLRKIQTFISLIADREYNNLSASGREYFLKIGKSAGRMSALIKDLLNYSRTATSKKVFETVSLKNIVTDVLHDFEEETTQKGAEISLLDDCDVRVIAFQFRQALYNLVSNALKFSQEGVLPRVQISCSYNTGAAFNEACLRPEQEYCMVAVQDNGIGFDQKYNEKIFELFQRLETKELQTGTGIGLTIVKKIVDNHKGFIVANSMPNVGTTFKMYLPALPVAVEAF
jgi:signal transduction histidine kinase